MPKKTLLQHLVGPALTAAFLCLTINSTTSAGSFIRGCAARDMQVLMLIEARESQNAISAQESSDAILTIMHARMVCYEGRVLEGLALYESISRKMTEDRSLAELH